MLFSHHPSEKETYVIMQPTVPADPSKPLAPVPPVPGMPVDVPIPPIEEPEPDLLPDEYPNPNHDGNDDPQRQA